MPARDGQIFAVTERVVRSGETDAIRQRQAAQRRDDLEVRRGGGWSSWPATQARTESLDPSLID